MQVRKDRAENVNTFEPERAAEICFMHSGETQGLVCVRCPDGVLRMYNCRMKKSQYVEVHLAGTENAEVLPEVKP